MMLEITYWILSFAVLFFTIWMVVYISMEIWKEIKKK